MRILNKKKFINIFDYYRIVISCINTHRSVPVQNLLQYINLLLLSLIDGKPAHYRRRYSTFTRSV